MPVVRIYMYIYTHTILLCRRRGIREWSWNAGDGSGSGVGNRKGGGLAACRGNEWMAPGGRRQTVYRCL